MIKGNDIELNNKKTFGAPYPLHSKKGVLIFVQILTHLLVGFCNTSLGVLNTSFGVLKYTPKVCFTHLKVCYKTHQKVCVWLVQVLTHL